MKLLKLKRKFKSWYSIYSATYDVGNGAIYEHDVVSDNPLLNKEDLGKSSPSAVILFCKTNDNTVLAINEFRMPVNSKILDLPAGTIDPGESPEIAGLRELKEETGYYDVTIDFVLPPSYSSPGMTDQSLTTIFCTLNSYDKVKTDTEISEEISSFFINKREAKELLTTHKIAARAQLLLHFWANN